MRAATLTAGFTVVMLAACSGEGPAPISDFGAAEITPFERDLVTQQELKLPATFNSLPRPTLGSSNLADPL